MPQCCAAMAMKPSFAHSLTTYYVALFLLDSYVTGSTIASINITLDIIPSHHGDHTY